MSEIEKAIQRLEEYIGNDCYTTGFQRICSTAITALHEKLERQKNDPLTIKELREMDGEPVWVACKPLEGGDGYWCLCRYGTITTPATLVYDAEEIPHWVFYRHKPEKGAEDERV